jgi:RNA polymerase sigma factor (sigma-70 family)
MLRARIDPALEGRVGAEAILQETFLTARRRWAGRPLADQMSPYAWLVWLARQSLIDSWRREHPGREIPWCEQSSAAIGINLAGKGTTPSAALARKEIQELVRNVLESLDPIDREIIWLVDFENLSYGEVGQILDLKPNTANQRHYRALRRFKELLPRSLHPGEAP